MPPEPANDDVPALRRGLRRWRAGALVSGGIAACLAALLAVPRPVPPPVIVAAPRAALPAQLAVAQLEDDDGRPLLAAGFDRASGQLRLRVLDLPRRARVPELWVIPPGGSPHSLGLVRDDGTVDRVLAPDERRYLAPGATLAVTLEPRDGAPHAAPSGAILASGPVSVL